MSHGAGCFHFLFLVAWAFPSQEDRAICIKGGFYWGSAPRSRWGQVPPAATQGVGSLTSSLLVLPSRPLQPSHPRAPALFLPWAFSADPSPPLGALSLTSSQNPSQSLPPGPPLPSSGQGLIPLPSPRPCVCAWGAGGIWEAKPNISRAHPGSGPEVVEGPAWPHLAERMMTRASSSRASISSAVTFLVPGSNCSTFSACSASGSVSRRPGRGTQRLRGESRAAAARNPEAVP